MNGKCIKAKHPMQKRTHKRFVFAPIKCVKCFKKIELGEDYYTNRSGNEHCENCYNYHLCLETYNGSQTAKAAT